MNARNARRIFPIYAVTGGCAAFILRIIQNHAGFEPDTGLPVSGVFTWALPVLLAAYAVGLMIFSFYQTGGYIKRNAVENTGKNPGDNYMIAFPFRANRAWTPYVIAAGGGLMILAGLIDLAESVGIAPHSDAAALLLREIGLGAGTLLPVSGVLTLSAGVVWILFAAAGKSPELADRYGGADAGNDQNGADTENITEKRTPRRELILIPPVAMVVRLVSAYRLDSINPVMERYWIELLALSFLTLACYSLSGFAFQSGNLRRFVLYAGCGVIFMDFIPAIISGRRGYFNRRSCDSA